MLNVRRTQVYRDLAPNAVSRRRTDELLAVDPRSVAGSGAFARRDISEREPILTFSGRLLAADTIAQDVSGLQIGPRLWLVTETGDGSVEDYLNHSCEPNAGFLDGTLTLRALRPIRAGEEVCWDYSTSIDEPGWRIRCRCRAPSCRGAITSHRALSPADRDRLRSIALAYLR